MRSTPVLPASSTGWRNSTISKSLRSSPSSDVEAGHLQRLDHIFMLLDSEIEPFIAAPGSMKATLAHRYEHRLELGELEPPFIVADGDVPPLSEWHRKTSSPASPAAVAAAGDVLWGVPGCPGVARGTARVILDPLDPSALEPGDILVAPVTDSAWAPLFMTAGGVVANVGGQISHAIIVSRELGLPCVVSVEHATERIPDGAVIEVDGTTGQVTIVEFSGAGGESAPAHSSDSAGSRGRRPNV